MSNDLQSFNITLVTHRLAVESTVYTHPDRWSRDRRIIPRGVAGLSQQLGLPANGTTVHAMTATVTMVHPSAVAFVGVISDDLPVGMCW